jgi:type IV secretory pathway VirJ component
VMASWSNSTAPSDLPSLVSSCGTNGFPACTPMGIPSDQPGLMPTLDPTDGPTLSPTVRGPAPPSDIQDAMIEPLRRRASPSPTPYSVEPTTSTESEVQASSQNPRQATLET